MKLFLKALILSVFCLAAPAVAQAKGAVCGITCQTAALKNETLRDNHLSEVDARHMRIDQTYTVRSHPMAITKERPTIWRGCLEVVRSGALLPTATTAPVTPTPKVAPVTPKLSTPP